MKKIIGLFIVSVFIISMLITSVFGNSGDINNIIVAVNTNTTGNKVEGKYTVDNEITAISIEPSFDNINDLHASGIDDDGIIILDPNLPEVIIDSPEILIPDANMNKIESSYQINDTKTIKTNDKITPVNVKCLYVGQYCTVWAEIDCNEYIKLTSEKAIQIGVEFDSKMVTFNTYFPYAQRADFDSDGKIGIYCYDIDKDYGKAIDSYVSGYFWNYDFELNGMDMIHIDTYPGMGSNLNNISRCYSTLFHEYQHYINYSARYLNNISKVPETYLNEAFSMAVEQLLYGTSAMTNRINTFNTNMSTITNGMEMTVWDGTNSLNKYSLSYVFGQYLRTRYNQLHGVQANMLFSEIINGISTNKSNRDTLDIIAGILNTNKNDLIKDFWVALYLREDTGRYGFNGDNCIGNLNEVYINTIINSNTTKGIYNGGAKYYGIPNADYVTITSYNNISFFFGDANRMVIDVQSEPSFISKIFDILFAPFRILINGFTAFWQAIFGGNNNVEYEVSLLKDGVNVATVLTTATSYDFTKEIMKNGIGVYSVIVTALGDGITTANSESVKSENTFTYNGGASILSGITISNQCVVKVSSGKGGLISQEGTLVVPTGITIKFDIIPDEGYEIKDVLINGISIGAVSSCKYTADISLPYSTIYAEFAKIIEEPLD